MRPHEFAPSRLTHRRTQFQISKRQSPALVVGLGVAAICVVDCAFAEADAAHAAAVIHAALPK